MKAKWLTIALLVVAGHVQAQVGELYDANVIDMTAVSDPAKAMNAGEGHWLAFSLPVLEGTRSPCCWKGRWNGVGEVGCSLEPKHQSYGTRSDSPLADNVIVYSGIHQGRVHTIRLVGDQCPVEGDGAQVTWIGTVEEIAGLDWLETVARSDADSAGDGALYALALHRSPDASQRLYELALNTDGDLSEEALFWLGEARGEVGTQMLLDLARNNQIPRDIRRQALFWLAQSDNENTIAALTELLTR